MSWGATAAVKSIVVDPLGKRISAREKLVLFVIADYYNEEYRCAWAGLSSIARDSLTSRRHLQTIISKLEERVLLNVERRERETNIYRFPFLGLQRVEVPREATSLPREITARGREVATAPPREVATAPEPPMNLQLEPTNEKACASHPLFEIWQQEHGSLPQVRALATDRLSKCRLRVKNSPDTPRLLADFREAVRLANQTPFLSGSNDRGWVANFDWFIANDSNYLKVIEGKYQNGAKQKCKESTVGSGVELTEQERQFYRSKRESKVAAQ